MIARDPATGELINNKKATGVTAIRGQGRWQYRDRFGRILASGISPEAFCKAFWFRDDYAGDVS